MICCISFGWVYPLFQLQGRPWHHQPRAITKEVEGRNRGVVPPVLETPTNEEKLWEEENEGGNDEGWVVARKDETDE